MIACIVITFFRMRCACRDCNTCTSRPRTAANAESQMTNLSFDTFDESKVHCLTMHCLIIMRTFTSINIFPQMTKMFIFFKYYIIMGSVVDF